MDVPTLWNVLPSSVKAFGNITKFRRHLNTFLYNLVSPPQFPGVSFSLMTKDLFIDYEIGQPFLF